MPEVTFIADAITVHAKLGESLMDVCAREAVSIPFGCKRGNCGTCLITIGKGKELLTPPSDAERAMLAIYGTSDAHRLACQCTVPGDLTIDDA